MALASEILIEAVQKYPVLYDSSHKDYKNNRIKNKVWDAIAETMGENDGAAIKKQWKNLRDAYNKHLRSCRSSSTGHETKLIDRYKSWPWAKLMSFLRPHIKFVDGPHTQSDAEGVGSSEFSLENNDDEAGFSLSTIQIKSEEPGSPQSTDTFTLIDTAQQLNNSYQFQQNNIPQHMHRRRKRTSSKTHSQIDKVINFMSQNIDKDDDIDLLFKSYSIKLRKMTRRRQAIVKFEIAKIMLKAELEEFDEIQSKSEAEQNMVNNMAIEVQLPVSSVGSDTNESSYNVSPPSSVLENPLSPSHC